MIDTYIYLILLNMVFFYLYLKKKESNALIYLDEN